MIVAMSSGSGNPLYSIDFAGPLCQDANRESPPHFLPFAARQYRFGGGGGSGGDDQPAVRGSLELAPKRCSGNCAELLANRLSLRLPADRLERFGPRLRRN